MSNPHTLDELGVFAGQTDVGSVGSPGSCDFNAETATYTVKGSGQNIWDDHDDFHLVWRRMRGDFIVTAHAAFVGEGTNAHRKLGWMARASLDTRAAHASAAVHGDGLLSLQYRPRTGEETREAKAPIAHADVVQLERRGDTFIMSVARFGEPFVSVAVDDLALGDDLYVGLFVCSHEDEIVEASVFSNVRLVVPARPEAIRSVHYHSRLEILDVASGARKLLYETDDTIEAPNWTRDGKALIYNTGGRLWRFDLESRESKMIDTGAIVRNNNDHVLSFDGETLAISSHEGENHASIVYTVPVTGGTPNQVTATGPSYLHGWSQDDRFLVYTAERGGQYDIYRIPVAGGEEEQLTNEPGLDDGPEYDPDGTFIYFNSVRSGRMQIWRMAPDGSNPEQLTDDEYNNWFPHVSPDGSAIAYVSYLVGETEPGDHPPGKRVSIRVMPCAGGPIRTVAYLYGGQGTMNVPSWSPDSKRLAFVSYTLPLE
ncbi:MAG: TolB family protein [Spirochaetota bacterium]